MLRRTFLNLAGRTAVCTWAASFWGNYQAKSTVSNAEEANGRNSNSNPPKSPRSTQELDAIHRARREAFENRQTSSTATVAVATSAALALTTSFRSNLRKSNIEHPVDDALVQIPQDERPEGFKDVRTGTKNYHRRAFLGQAGAGVLIGGVLGPLVTWFFDPGEGIADHVHGPKQENEPEVVTLHRETTRARQNTASTALNSACIGGLFLSPAVLPTDKEVIQAKYIAVGKYRLSQLFKSKNEVGFIVVDNLIMSRENLLDHLPDSLKDEHRSLEVQIERKGQKETFFIDYINGRHLVRSVHGEHFETKIILQNEDKVTIKAFQVGWNGNGKAVRKTNGN